MLIYPRHKRFAFFISLLFLIVSCSCVLFHELWIDEAYHYLLSRDSSSLAEVYKNGTETGHPVLWNCILFVYKFVFPTITAMQILHCLIATICIFLINRYSPFSKVENLMITFGYFFLYEYNNIAKNYIAGFCLIFLALVLYSAKKPFFIISLLLALACNLHLFTLFVSVSLFLYIILQKETRQGKSKIALCIGLMVTGIICALVQIVPSAEHINEYRSYDVVSFFSPDRLGRSLGVMCRGLFNIPDFRKPDYWNSNLFFNVNRISCYLLSLASMLLIFLSLKRYKWILLLFFLPVLAIMGFVYIMPLSTGVRYWGYAYVLLIICFWLYKTKEPLKPFSVLFFRIVLAIQVIVAVPALFIDYSRPFSNARYAALGLERKNLLEKPLFVQSLALGPSLSAYTGKKLYYPANKSFESFSYQINNRKFSAEEFLMESLKGLNTMKAKSCILVMNESLRIKRDTLSGDFSLDEIGVYTGAVITSENYYLYLLSTY